MTDSSNASSEERREKLPTDGLPSTDSSPYPVMLRHADRRASYVPPGWHPGMVEKISGHINYMSVNNIAIPDRYYRGPSNSPFPHPGLKCVMRTLQCTLKKDHKKFHDFLESSDVLTGQLWDNETQDGLIDCELKKETKFRILQAERDWAKQQRDFRTCPYSLFSLCNISLFYQTYSVVILK